MKKVLCSMLAILVCGVFAKAQAQELLTREELITARRMLVQERMREMKEALDKATADAIQKNAVNAELMRLRRMTSPPVVIPEPKPIRTTEVKIDTSKAPEGLGTHLRVVFKDHPEILAKFSAEQLSKTNPPFSRLEKIYGRPITDILKKAQN